MLSWWPEPDSIGKNYSHVLQMACVAEPQPVRDKMEGYSRLMQTRQDVRTLCRLLDREEQDGHVSWHVIVTSPLLGYDRDFLSFLE